MNSYPPPTAGADAVRGVRSAPPGFPTSVATSGAQAVNLTALLWGINWRDHMPLAASDDGIMVELADVDAAERFARENFGEIFGESLARRRGEDQETVVRARSAFVGHVCDVFAFRNGDVTVGMFVGNPVDWSTYYIRSLTFLESYQGRTLHHRLLKLLFRTLAERGVERVEAETAPTNAPCISALLKHRFVASGTSLSDRWGALCKFTCYLGEVQRCEFFDRFSHSAELHGSRYRGRDS